MESLARAVQQTSMGQRQSPSSHHSRGYIDGEGRMGGVVDRILGDGFMSRDEIAALGRRGSMVVVVSKNYCKVRVGCGVDSRGIVGIVIAGVFVVEVVVVGIDVVIVVMYGVEGFEDSFHMLLRGKRARSHGRKLPVWGGSPLVWQW